MRASPSALLSEITGPGTRLTQPVGVSARIFTSAAASVPRAENELRPPGIA